MVNTELLLEELRFLTINPDKWDQDRWVEAVTPDEETRPSACGSFGCLAGNIVLHQGIELEWFAVGHVDSDGVDEEFGYWPIAVLNPGVVWIADTTVQGKLISQAANEILGLGDTHHSLFSGSNTLDTLWRKAESLTNGEINQEHFATALAERDLKAKESTK